MGNSMICAAGNFVTSARIGTDHRYLMLFLNKIRNPILGDRTACVGNVANVHFPEFCKQGGSQ